MSISSFLKPLYLDNFSSSINKYLRILEQKDVVFPLQEKSVTDIGILQDTRM